MKILFITDNFPPEVNAPASRTYEHCIEWVKEGADVTVLTCAPNFPQGVVFEGYKNSPYQIEMVEGIKVIRVWSYIAANAGFAKRILDYISFAFMAFWAGLFEKADVIVATSPQFFTTFTGFSLSLIKRRPWVFELRDLWPESIVTVGAMDKGLAIRFLEKIERFMYRHADMIVAVTDAFKARLVDYGIDPAKISVVTNGVDPTLFPPLERNTALRQQLGIEDKFVIGYIGTHGMAHSLEFIVGAMAELKDRTIHLQCVGDGARKAAIVEKASDLGVTNVSFLDPVPKSEVSQYIAALDAVLVPLRKSDTFKTVIPSKIFEAACMRKPILLGVDGQAREIIEQFEAGLFFEPEDRESFLTSLKRLSDDSMLCERLSEGGKKLAEAYDRRSLAMKMKQQLVSLSERKLSRR